MPCGVNSESLRRRKGRHRLSGDTFHNQRYDFSRKVVPLIVKGVPTQTVTSFSTAQRLGIDPTGHGCFSPERGAYESAKCIVMEGGETSLVELVTDCQQAILISSLGDVRLLDPKTMTLSG